MRILIVTQYFWPENFRVNDLVLGLKARGHEVTVLTGKPNYPGGSFFPGYGFFRRPRDDYHGITVYRVPLIPRGRGDRLRLALNYLSFALAASLVAPFRCRGAYDLIFVYEPSPITVGIPALVLKWLRKTPVMFWVLDLWPESVSATGAVRSRFLLNAIGGLVRAIYRGCDRILVQSRAFEPHVTGMDVPAERIRYFPNWAEELFDLDARGASAAVRPDALPPGFRVMFAGNIGAAQDFPGILAAAERLKSDGGIHWIILGDGRMREWVEREVHRRGLAATVHLPGSYPLESMPGYFREADVMLVTLKRDPIFALTIPGKLQSYLACGRPVLGMLDGEGARVIEESGAGLACGAEQPEALARLVLALHGMDKSGREAMGRRGRAYYEANFAREHLLRRLESWMDELKNPPL